VGVDVRVGVGDGVRRSMHQGAVALRSKKLAPQLDALTLSRSAWTSSQQVTLSCTEKVVVGPGSVKFTMWVVV
jgi:hypothetical protein